MVYPLVKTFTYRAGRSPFLMGKSTFLWEVSWVIGVPRNGWFIRKHPMKNGWNQGGATLWKSYKKPMENGLFLDDLAKDGNFFDSKLFVYWRLIVVKKGWIVIVNHDETWLIPFKFITIIKLTMVSPLAFKWVKSKHGVKNMVSPVGLSNGPV